MYDTKGWNPINLHSDVSRRSVHHAPHILTSDAILIDCADHGCRCLAWYAWCRSTIDNGSWLWRHVVLMMHGSRRDGWDGRNAAGILIRRIHRCRYSTRISRGDGLQLRNKAGPHLAHLGRVLGLDSNVFHNGGAHLVGFFQNFLRRSERLKNKNTVNSTQSKIQNTNWKIKINKNKISRSEARK